MQTNPAQPVCQIWQKLLHDPYTYFLPYPQIFFPVIPLDWVNGTAVVALIPITLTPYFFHVGRSSPVSLRSNANENATQVVQNSLTGQTVLKPSKKVLPKADVSEWIWKVSLVVI